MVRILEGVAVGSSARRREHSLRGIDSDCSGGTFPRDCYDVGARKCIGLKRLYCSRRIVVGVCRLLGHWVFKLAGISPCTVGPILDLTGNSGG